MCVYIIDIEEELGLGIHVSPCLVQVQIPDSTLPLQFLGHGVDIGYVPVGAPFLFSKLYIHYKVSVGHS